MIKPCPTIMAFEIGTRTGRCILALMGTDADELDPDVPERFRPWRPPIFSVQAELIDEVALLARWQATRSATLADLLCCVPIAVVWPSRFANIEGRVKGPYLPWVVRCFEALPDDPRTTMFLVAMLDRAEWRDAQSRPLWEHVFERLVQLRDVRCIARLRALAADPADFFQPKTTRWVATEMARVADVLAAMKLPADDAQTRRLAKAQPILPPKDGFFCLSTEKRDTLLERVWAAPDDLELRAVIGDALQEIGDPRGELIALQLQKATSAKAAIAKLLDDHARSLAGPIGTVAIMAPDDLAFEAGFLTAVQIGTGDNWSTSYDWGHAATTVFWRTVERVSFGQRGKLNRKWFQAWWSSGHLGLLRRIKVGDGLLVRANAASPWLFEQVSAQHDVALIEALLRAMPREELVRIPLPPGHPLHELVGTIAGLRERRPRSASSRGSRRT